jgi:hypothetical protein
MDSKEFIVGLRFFIRCNANKPPTVEQWTAIVSMLESMQPKEDVKVPEPLIDWVKEAEKLTPPKIGYPFTWDWQSGTPTAVSNKGTPTAVSNKGTAGNPTKFYYSTGKGDVFY